MTSTQRKRPKTPTPAEARAARRAALGVAIRNARQEHGLTQHELGERLEDTPQTTISRWEKGLVDLNLEQLCELEAALGLRLGTFAMATGFCEPDFTKADVVDILRADPNLHPDVRADMVRVYKSYTQISKRLG